MRGLMTEFRHRPEIYEDYLLYGQEWADLHGAWGNPEFVQVCSRLINVKACSNSESLSRPPSGPTLVPVTGRSRLQRGPARYVFVPTPIDCLVDKKSQDRSPLPRSLMAIPSEITTTTLCSHCEKDIPTPNIELHLVHCSRNLQKCTICGDMIPRKHADEHYNDAHAPVNCSLCSETVPRDVLSVHKGEKCPQRMVTCEYCEFPLPAVDLFKHQETCGNRTELCHICSKYIRLRERIGHEIQFHGNSNGAAESSRNRVPEREVPGRRPARDASQRKILFTIAITGIAVLLGSFFLQRRADSQQHQ